MKQSDITLLPRLEVTPIVESSQIPLKGTAVLSRQKMASCTYTVLFQHCTQYFKVLYKDLSFTYTFTHSYNRGAVAMQGTDSSIMGNQRTR